MGLREELAIIERKLEDAIDRTMQTDVADDVKLVLAESVEQNVYEKYTPTGYTRRGNKNGGLADPSVMEVRYSPTEHLLEVQDMSRDEFSGRLIAPVVEIGEGYEWEDSQIYKKQPFPREFHRPAEEMMIDRGLLEDALRVGLAREGFKTV